MMKKMQCDTVLIVDLKSAISFSIQKPPFLRKHEKQKPEDWVPEKCSLGHVVA